MADLPASIPSGTTLVLQPPDAFLYIAQYAPPIQPVPGGLPVAPFKWKLTGDRRLYWSRDERQPATLRGAPWIVKAMTLIDIFVADDWSWWACYIGAKSGTIPSGELWLHPI